MKYDKWKFLYMPRPDNAIASAMLNYYEKRGWLAQYKKNGTATIIGISPEKEFHVWNRHKELHKTWQLTPYLKKELIRLFPEKKWFVLCAEILHLKTPHIKDTLFIHDMLVWQGEFLLGSTFISRQKLLDERLVTKDETDSHYICDTKGEGKIWYAKRFDKNFKEIFLSINDAKTDEGLVLKDPDGTLKLCMKPTDNSDWQVKCRHSTKGYAF